MSATYADNTPEADVITNWRVNMGDGQGVQNLSGGAVNASGSYAAGCTGATISVTAVDANGHSTTQTSTAVFAPNLPTNVSATDDAGNTATVSFTATTAIAGSHYVIERLDPGSTSGWVTVDRIAATANGASQPYSFVDTGLVSGPVGTLYQVAAQGAAVTATAAGSAGLSAYALASLSGGAAAMASGINVSPPGLDVGGEAYVQINGISGSNPSAVTIQAVGYDPSVIQVISTSGVSSSGTATILVKGLAYGTSPFEVVASNGEGGSNSIGTTVPTVTAVQNSDNPDNAPTITEGVTDTSAGFVFSDAYASVTPVVVPFTTFGSTIDPTTLGVPSGGYVTIPANTSAGASAFFNTTIANDGKIAPTRYAIVTLQTPQVDTTGVGGQQATIAVANNNLPTITVNGASDNASIRLAVESNSNKLATINIATPHVGTLNGVILSWNPHEFLMWPTNAVGTPGTNDLASLPDATYDPSTGFEYYTWKGAIPTSVYGQGISGSAGWDTTLVGCAATVSLPATADVAAQSVTKVAFAQGTINGPELIWSGGAAIGNQSNTSLYTTAAHRDVLVGQDIDYVMSWQGPVPGNAQTATWRYNWNVPGRIYQYTFESATFNSVEDIDGYLAGSGSPSWYQPHSPSGYATSTTGREVDFTWAETATQLVTSSIALGGVQQSVTVRLDVTAPIVTVPADFASNPNDFSATMQEPGVMGAQVVLPASVQNPAAFSTSTWAFLQTVHDNSSDLGTDGNWYYNVAADDNSIFIDGAPPGPRAAAPFPYPNVYSDGGANLLNTGGILTTGGATYCLGDNPRSTLAPTISAAKLVAGGSFPNYGAPTTVSITEKKRSDNFRSWIMYMAPGVNSRWISLGVFSWHFNFDYQYGTRTFTASGPMPTYEAMLGLPSDWTDSIYVELKEQL